MALTEIGGNVPFPEVGELPCLITLGPHGFYWFRLEQTACWSVSGG
jgi:maltose alpha-D-glucosyltransferase/alpha-amylase